MALKKPVMVFFEKIKKNTTPPLALLKYSKLDFRFSILELLSVEFVSLIEELQK